MKSPPLEIFVVIPVLALLALATIRMEKSAPRLKVAGSLVALVFGGFLLARFFVPDSWIWPDSEVSRRTNWLVKHLTKSESWETRPVIFLVGSSATNYGLDPQRLEAVLAGEGFPATVLSFCMPGDNHHERIFMVEQFLSELSPTERKKLSDAKVFYLGEIFDAYDFHPLYRMEKEAFTQRAVMFLGPKKAVQAWAAYVRFLESHPDAPRWKVGWMLAEHALINRFAVGAFSSMHPPPAKRRRTPPFFPLDGKKTTFNFQEALSIWKNSENPPMDLPAIPGPLAITNSHLRSLMDPYVDRYGYYALPTLEPPRMRYALRFGELVAKESLVLGPPSAEDLAPMLLEQYWFDGVHPTGEGAKFFTDWLAKALLVSLNSNQAP